MKKEINTLIFSGGGVKGLAYIGVLKKIEEYMSYKIDKIDKITELDEYKFPKFDINHICSVSAGSIFGLTYLLGYSSEEIEKEVLNKKFERLKHIKLSNLISYFGLDSGNNIVLWLESLITNKGYNKDITLKEFYEEIFLKTSKYMKFDIIATNLNKYEYTVFNHVTTPNLKVVDAIRMSISIPFVFTVTKYDINLDRIGCGDIYVDGGLIESYPIHLFKDGLDNVLGFHLLTGKENVNDNKRENIESIEQYVYHVFRCFGSQRSRRLISNQLYKDHTIYINTNDITSSINFNLSVSNKKKLIELGYECATKFFENK